jgi:lantibiotic biosynthesis protein
VSLPISDESDFDTTHGKAILLGVVESIAAEVINHGRQVAEQPLDLGDGLAGQMLFLAHLSKFRDVDGHIAAVAVDAMWRITKCLAETATLCGGLFTGIAGICWAIKHCADLLEVEDFRQPDTFDETQEFVGSYLDSNIEFDYDLINGVTGIGLWILTTPHSERRTKILRQILELILKSAEHYQGGFRWPTPRVRRHSLGNSYKSIEGKEFNLGLAHGMPCIIGFLVKCVRHNVETQMSLWLLEGAVTWLRAQALPNESVAVFSVAAATDHASRLAWCYGDAGIALTLFPAAEVLQSESLREFALSIVRKIAARRISNSSIVDAGICHGSAGIVHICSRLSAFAESEALNAARKYWLNRLIQFGSADSAKSKFPAWNPMANQFEYRSGLLSGSSGVGLVLLSQIESNLGWDYPFLVP